MSNLDLSEPADVEAYLQVSAAPLAGIALSLVALWAFAIPRQLHAVSLEMANDCPQFVGQPLVIHTVVIDSSSRITWDGQELGSLEAMAGNMKSAAEMNLLNQVAVRIESHQQANYGSFIAVLASAQRNGIARVDVIEGEHHTSALMCTYARI